MMVQRHVIQDNVAQTAGTRGEEDGMGPHSNGGWYRRQSKGDKKAELPSFQFATDHSRLHIYATPFQPFDRVVAYGIQLCHQQGEKMWEGGNWYFMPSH